MLLSTPLSTSQDSSETLLNTEDDHSLEMGLRIIRGPLLDHENQTILSHYNRLTNSNIPKAEYLRWVQAAPDGAAWHAILENDASEIVGHSALIPMRGHCHGRQIVAGKAEYAFILEQYQTAKIRGFERSGRPRNAVMIQQLFSRCQEVFDPLFISTLPASRRSLLGANRATVSIPVLECLLILRPWRAARQTPNLRHWQRLSLCFGGVLQKTAWLGAGVFPGKQGQICKVPIGSPVLRAEGQNLSFFDDLDSVTWRYSADQYERLSLEGEPNTYVIVKRGSVDRYLRVCQWRLGAAQPSFRLLAELVKMARSQGALGVRWAVYGLDDAACLTAKRMRAGGFLCAQRDRTLVVHTAEQDFLSPDKWSLSDAMFSFDP